MFQNNFAHNLRNRFLFCHLQSYLLYLFMSSFYHFSLVFMLLPAGSSLLQGPPLLTQRLPPSQHASLPSAVCRASFVSARDLAPSIFPALKLGGSAISRGPFSCKKRPLGSKELLLAALGYYFCNIASNASPLFSFSQGFFFFKRKSLYALFEGWLLLSLPSHCLSFRTKFDTLSPYLGALTKCLGCSRLGYQNYSGYPHSRPRGSRFGV